MSGTSNTSALVFGGGLPGAPPTANTESYNGTNWTEVNNLNTARRDLGGGGTATAALAFCGNPPDSTGVTELWNGTNWTEVNDLNSGRYSPGEVGQSSTAILACGGGDPAKALVEEWNGTNWTETTDMSTARRDTSGGGTTSSGIIMSGYTGTAATANSEEWTGAGASVTRTFTDS
jgi:hypothetical protein